MALANADTAATTNVVTRRDQHLLFSLNISKKEKKTTKPIDAKCRRRWRCVGRFFAKTVTYICNRHNSGSLVMCELVWELAKDMAIQQFQPTQPKPTIQYQKRVTQTAESTERNGTREDCSRTGLWPSLIVPFHKKKSLLIYLSKIHCTWIRWLFGWIDWSCWLLLLVMIHDVARMQLEIILSIYWFILFLLSLYRTSPENGGDRRTELLTDSQIVHTVLNFIWCFIGDYGGHPSWVCIRCGVSSRWFYW